MKGKKNSAIFLIIGFIAIGAIGYGLVFGDEKEPAGGGGGNPLPPSLEEPGEVPEEKPEPGEEPREQPEPTGKPNSGQTPAQPPNSGQIPAEYVIYADQQLVLPVAGNGAGVASVVIDSGTLTLPEKQIALTFDAGWLYDQTTALLDVLDDYGVKSTFFLRGKWVEDHPDLARDILGRGHSVENHSLTHGHMKDMTDEEVRQEMAVSTQIIEDVTGYRPYLFRPPFGEYDSRILKILSQQGYPFTVKWTVDSLDWAEEMNGTKITEQYLIDRVLSKATDKGIVLMHVGGYQTVNALPEIIEGLKKEGYRLVKVNDMVPSKSTSGGQTIYTVKKGDTLSSIARQYGITVADILEVNPAR